MTKRGEKVGLAFADELHKVSGPAGHFGKNQRDSDKNWEDIFIPNYQSEEIIQTPSSWRVICVASVFIIIFFVLFIRLFHLQVVSGYQYRLMADTNRVQIRVIHAPRGVIYDRNGKVLAENNPGFRLKEEIISRDQALEMEAKNDPAFGELEIDTIRYYPYGEITSHILGYVGQISSEELEDPKYKGYRIGDRIGRAGIEKVYEDILRGRDGAEIVEVDAQGRKLRTIRTIEPIPGKNLYLSIDIDLQKAAYEALKKGIKEGNSCCGATIVEDPTNGEILALISLPTYDSNVFTDPTKSEKVGQYFSDPNSPLLNRAISGVYPPGSTFKITSSLAGLASGKITENTKIEDTGVVELGPFKFYNWYFTSYGKTDGLVDIVKALQRSNDIFYYRLGEQIGEEAIAKTAKALGMGERLGIDLPGEAEGLIPSDQWKRENIGQQWYPGDTLHFAIGQGFLLTTPLQISAQTAFVAGNGVLYKPHLVTKITQPDGSVIKEFDYEPLAKDLFSRDDLELIKKGLEAVTKEGGTAWPFFNFTIPTAGKTGTAEFGDPDDNTHAWYTAYAPVDDPRITVTVLIEAGGEGSSIASPVAKDILTWYFNEDKTNIKSLDWAPVATDSARTLGE